VKDWAVLGLIALGAIVLGIAVGPSEIALREVLGALVGRGDPTVLGIVRDLRVPRALLAFLVGGSLAMAGASLQAESSTFLCLSVEKLRMLCTCISANFLSIALFTML
jgi:ABC-type enterobactin transport system permease subunit